ncbi:cyclic nucleotide-binding domain-containing protein (plasmid) [Kovacikia minuta CCNUW1]|uniref:Crp/Fnr family transcriptional regulator n=1 Tax=Kovacikia minuta TaxID=2931930 RepID=UPI001CCF20AA|nr:cyclic nucleotide-binding domain-containing protein [Kovacikia minuta]UBF30617.1 cyclic nucleotide-binding domain-containing protein [Kovacikia minuta CCNUW1]
MTNATVEQLATVALFAQLQPEQLANLQPHSVIRSYQTGERIVEAGDHLPARLYALLDGLLRVSKIATTGKETIFRTLTPGDIFAAPALFGKYCLKTCRIVSRRSRIWGWINPFQKNCTADTHPSS